MRALLSVSDKTGLVPFTQQLKDRGWEIVSTGGTLDKLKEAKVDGAMSIYALTEVKEVMGGRVKTINHRVAGGILARRGNPKDMQELTNELSGVPIDLVAVNLYPFAKTAANPATSFDELIENIDIGGPGLVRAAAKNFRDVLVVIDPADYDRVLEQLALPNGPTLAFRFEMAKKAIAHTADYDRVISATLEDIKLEGEEFTRAPQLFPAILRTTSQKIADLRYGENPHQRAAWYATANYGLGNATVHQGKELSFTNLLDLDAAMRIVSKFTEPAAVVVKHTNPCGVATAIRVAAAYVLAREADALSAFGGIVGINQSLDVATARAICDTFVECVIAPRVDPGALKILAAKPNLRVVTATFPDRLTLALDQRSIFGGSLIQEQDFVDEAAESWPVETEHEGEGSSFYPRVVTKRGPTAVEWEAMRFAWRVCAYVKSNAVVFADQYSTLGIGGGQPNRVGSAKIAGGILHGPNGRAQIYGEIKAAGGSCVAASDAFFPKPDGLEEAVRFGATAVVQPGGSKEDPAVIAAADELGIAMVFTGRRHFRH